jgi:hypothetical protein
MSVIVHQREAVNGKAMLLRRPPKERDEDLAIRVVSDDRAAIDASLDHVNADVGDEDPWSSSHGSAIGIGARSVLDFIPEIIGLSDRPSRITHTGHRSEMAETATGSDGCQTPLRTPV